MANVPSQSKAASRRGRKRSRRPRAIGNQPSQAGNLVSLVPVPFTGSFAAATKDVQVKDLDVLNIPIFIERIQLDLISDLNTIVYLSLAEISGDASAGQNVVWGVDSVPRVVSAGSRSTIYIRNPNAMLLDAREVAEAVLFRIWNSNAKATLTFSGVANLRMSIGKPHTIS